MFFISFVSGEWRTSQTNFLLWVFLIINTGAILSASTGVQKAGAFTAIVLKRSVCAKPGASIRAFSCVRGCTTSAFQQGYRNWRVFGGGSWKGWLFMGCAASISTHMMKFSPRCPEIDFLLLFFSFFLQKKEQRMQWGIACNVVQLRFLSLLQTVWQRASLHGYKTKSWTREHLFFLCEKHTRSSSHSWMVLVGQVGEIFTETQKTKCFRVQGETQ